MSIELIKYAFSAGELSPKLFGRTDLTKYDLGLAQAKNWFVDYTGGLSTRPGTEFVEPVKADDKATKFAAFQFSPTVSNTYVLLFGDYYLRFIQDGSYVLEDPSATITAISAANPAVFTLASHGLASGDWIKLYDMGTFGALNGSCFVVDVINANTFRLEHFILEEVVDGTQFPAYGGGGYFQRVYEVVTPYSAEDLAELSTDQRRDLIRLTHPRVPIQNLTRNDHTDWDLSEEIIGGTRPVPQITFVSPSNTGTASVGYCVSAVYDDGIESYASYPAFAHGIVNFTTTAGQVRVAWDPLPEARSYIIYRTRVVSQDKVDAGSEMGYIGTTKSTFFVDSNIIPDFTKTPYEGYNPFAGGAITDFQITTPGSGYGDIALVTALGAGGTGVGFRAYLTSSIGGSMTAAVIVDRGYGFVMPVTFTVDPPVSGTTAVVTADVTPETGLSPSISTIFQQRQIYAASQENPLTVWGSRPRPGYSNFNITSQVNDNDSYEFEVDSAQVTPILHMLPTRGGLLLMSESGIWLLSGGGAGQAVTPTNALADPQVYNGVSHIRPLYVASEILYAESKGISVRLLSYNDFSKVYSGTDQSILSSHLFGTDKSIVNWCYADSPHKVVWAVRSDGRALSFTIVKEQDVYAWTWAQTQGYFLDVISIEEDRVDRVYWMVQRTIDGKVRKFVERMVPRSFANIEDAWFLDCALTSALTVYESTLTISPETYDDETDETTVVLLSSVGLFTGKEGYWIRAAGGIYVIDSVTSSTVCTAIVVESAKDLIPETTEVAPQSSFTLDVPRTTFGGLSHLEGRTVKVLADGNVLNEYVVTDGKVELETAATRVTIGLGYQAVAQTLPPTTQQATIETRRKRIVGVGVRLHESRGLKFGRTLADRDLYELKERTTEGYGLPTSIQEGVRYAALSTDWDENGQTFIVQDDPLPGTLLGLVVDMEVGDDTN